MTDHELIARLHREQWGRVVAASVRTAGDLDLAEDCAQRAYERALETWGDDPPDNPVGWLVRVANRLALDTHRHAAVERRALPRLVTDAPTDDGPDLLRLVLLCCHPALDRTSQAALTLRLVCGVSTDSIARALLVRRPTAAARITRAKHKIARAGAPYRLPEPDELPERMAGALEVIHLVATTAHERERLGEGDDLTERAWILARSLVDEVPDDPEPRGLLALIVLNAARAGSRVGPDGERLLGEQDRTKWDVDGVRAGLRLATEALTAGVASEGGPGRFALQAGITGLHAQAPSLAETDWSAVISLYDRLCERWPTPVVLLNRAIARSYVEGPAAALEELDALQSAPALRDYPYLQAARGALLADLNHPAEAAAAYERALAVAVDDEQARFLRARMDAIHT
ncbi:RNA polymerase sigma factor [Solicola gregarius]|uniref:RNA polymerase sigma factor n=1 Tax=Solicola gregarius TaxID=2908642 RepID=A0AA46TFQ1_9ACTN|nr:DUF6596 domain-containing protein [Solicola gregarius]UYM04471.1 RNA polymerase sigma factor [Solicola gregarius]